MQDLDGKVAFVTGGASGIGLAMVCAQKGYPLVVTMAESFSVERRKLLRFLGARVVLTPASEMGTGMIAKVNELVEKHGWWQANQFDNPANPAAHTATTGSEIWQQMNGRVDAVVCGVGSGGTITGLGRYFAEVQPKLKMVLADPAGHLSHRPSPPVRT